MHKPNDRHNAVVPKADGAQAIPASELLTTLAHELRNLLDGSMRCLGNAQRSLEHHESPDEAIGQLTTVRGALERMSGLLNTAMHNAPGVLGSSEMAAIEPVKLGEAIEHAVDLIRPLAVASGVDLRTRLEPEASLRACGPLYPLILNGLRNAVEAIAVCRPAGETGQGFGEVVIDLCSSSDGGVVLRILDDGIGPPPGADEHVFGHGFSTKDGGCGIGLAVSYAIVRELPGASITLQPRAERAKMERIGAVLELRTGPAFDRR